MYVCIVFVLAFAKQTASGRARGAKGKEEKEKEKENAPMCIRINKYIYVCVVYLACMYLSLARSSGLETVQPPFLFSFFFLKGRTARRGEGERGKEVHLLSITCVWMLLRHYDCFTCLIGLKFSPDI